MEFKTSFDKAVHRNRLLAEAFYLRGDIEKYGTGFIRIREELKEYPQISLAVTSSDGFVQSVITELDIKNFKVTEKDVEKDVRKLGKTQKLIVSIIELNPYITIQVLSVETGINTRNIQKNLRQLKDKKIIERVGPDKGGYWKVLKK